MRSMCILAVSTDFSPLPLSWNLPGCCLTVAEGFKTCSIKAHPALVADVGSAQHQLQASGDCRHLNVLWQTRVGCLGELKSSCCHLQNLSWTLLCWVCPGSEENLGYCFPLRLPACGLQCLWRLHAALYNTFCWEKTGIRLTLLTGETTERKGWREAAVSQPSYHLQLGG